MVGRGSLCGTLRGSDPRLKGREEVWTEAGGWGDSEHQVPLCLGTLALTE